ncbi:recombination protein NinB [Hydrogenophaga aromaticivorans]|uniref:recombination protein NinB n=1 Tax=Hydrogenophaga aromaticivorans TaxID=2610898 RepID=UPI001B3735DE|nr:recombination protein NinB [Hydrogenophaga aromaticivorans]MBQ0917470.1 recombination protein NinB [Hydrogenophaga aromaticivorans]
MKPRAFTIPGDRMRAAHVIRAMSEFVIAMTQAGHSLVATFSEESKTREQEAKYHSMIGDIAEQAEHLGSKWTAEDWKRLLLDKFARETGRTGGKIIPNLDSNGVVEVGILSRKFGKREASEFIEFLMSWGAENGCYFTEKVTDPETGEIFTVTWQMAKQREEVAA